MPKADWMHEQLRRLASEGRLRTPKPPTGRVDFSSNDYLGLARDADLYARATARYRASGLPHGSTGSRLLTGHFELTQATESQIAGYLNAEAALLFPSGYQANVGLLSSIASRHDTILYDALVHASTHDGLRLSRATTQRFRHNDTDDLERKLTQAEGRVFVVTESLFSMDGDQAPLKAISTLVQQHDALLIVDEAHAVGIHGPGGRGLCEAAGMTDSVFARVATFGKALGGHGAAVLGSDTLKQYLLNTARSQIFTTALAPPSLAWLQVAFAELPTLDPDRAHVQAMVDTFQKHTTAISKSVLAESGPMLAVIVPGNTAVVRAAEALQAEGFDVRPIRKPTVAAGSERLRICLHSYNTTAEVAQLAKCTLYVLEEC